MDEEMRLAIKAYDEFTSVMGRFSNALEATEKAEKAMVSSTDAVNKAVEVMLTAIQKTGPPLSDAERAAREKAKADREAAQAAKEHSDRVDGLLQGLAALGILNTVKRGIEGVVDAGAALDRNLGILTGLTGQAADEAQTFLMALQGQQKGVTELSTGMLELGRAGYSAQQSMTALPELAQFAQASFMDMEKATSSVSVVLKAFGKDVANAGEVTDVFTMAANRSALGFDDFQLALAMSAGVSRMAGQDYRELIAVLSVLRDAGLGASDAGTSIKSAWLALMNPTDEAARVMKDLGINVYDAQGRMRSWADIVAQVEKALGPLNEQSRNLALTTIFGSDGVRAMALSMGRGSEYIRGLTADLRDSRGATAELAHEMGNTFTGAMQRTQADMEKLRITVFNDLKGAFSGVLEAVDTLVVGFNSLNPAARGLLELLVGAAGLAAAVGSVALLVRSTLVPVLTNLVTVMETAGLVAAGTGAAFNAMLGPIGLVAAAIGAIAIGVTAYVGAMEKERAETEQKNKALVDMVDRYEDLQKIIDDTGRTQEERNRAGQEQERLIQDIGDAFPRLVSKWGDHQEAVRLDTVRLEENTRAARENIRAKSEADYMSLQDQLTRLQADRASLQERLAEQPKRSNAVTGLFNTPSGDLPFPTGDVGQGFFVKDTAALSKELAGVNAQIDETLVKMGRLYGAAYGASKDLKDEFTYTGAGGAKSTSTSTYDPDAEKLREQAEKARVAGIRDQIDLMRHLVAMDDERVDTTAEQLAFLQQIRTTLGTTRDLDEAIYKLEKEMTREPLQEQLAAFEKRRQLGEVSAREEQRFYEQLVANAEQLKLTAKEKAEYEALAASAKKEADQQIRSDLEATARYNIDLTNATTAQQISALTTIRDMHQENSAEYRRLNLEVSELQERLQQETHENKLAEIEFDSVINRWTNEQKLAALREYLATAKDLTLEQQRELQQEIAQMQSQAERDQQDKLLGLYREGLEAQRRIEEVRLRDEHRAQEKAARDAIKDKATWYEAQLSPLRQQLETMQDQTKELERQKRLLEIQQQIREKDAELEEVRAMRNRVVVERDPTALLGFRIRRTHDEAKERELLKDRADLEKREADEKAKQDRERRQETLQNSIKALEKERDAKLKAMNDQLADMRENHGEELAALNEHWNNRLTTQNIKLALEKLGWQTHYADVLKETQAWRENMNAELAKLNKPVTDSAAALSARLGGALPAPPSGSMSPAGAGTGSAQAGPTGSTKVEINQYGNHHYDGVQGLEQAAQAWVNGARSVPRGSPTPF